MFRGICQISASFIRYLYDVSSRVICLSAQKDISELSLQVITPYSVVESVYSVRGSMSCIFATSPVYMSNANSSVC